MRLVNWAGCIRLDIAKIPRGLSWENLVGDIEEELREVSDPVQGTYFPLLDSKWLLADAPTVHHANEILPAEENADLDGQTLLHRASRGLFFIDNLELAKLLLDAGASPNDQDAEGYTPLFLASTYGQLEMTRLLLRAGALVDSKNNIGETPLHGAAAFDEVEIMRLLLDYGADLDSMSTHGVTPLLQAAARGQLEGVKFLLEAGASVNAKDDDGATPIYLASKSGNMVHLRCDSETFTDLRTF
ncbi:hypothetical protein P7C70_g5808, partial [Phenoliferia sp. Uapishka_3]